MRVFGQNWLCLGKMVEMVTFWQNWFYLCKMVVFGQNLFYLGRLGTLLVPGLFLGDNEDDLGMAGV